jgi:UTP-glucose-1-phosphate uridylyltransferase
MKPTLMIMAAGMGSRFGGLKQVSGVGPHGATLVDYSVYDALRAGFGKVVFIIRRDIEADFKETVGRKWESRVPVRYVYQELSMLPPGFSVPSNRAKPWGTGHAIWVAQAAVKEPFAVLNADDYYGPHSFKVMAAHLKRLKRNDQASFAMVGFKLKNTLSEFGTVSRGVCEVGKDGHLKKVVERLKIEKAGRSIRFTDENGSRHSLKGTETVSMNFWGFTPKIFGQLAEELDIFLAERGREEKAEMLIPRVVDDLVQAKKAKVKVLKTPDAWFGLTYPDDKSRVYEAIHKMVFKRIYPENLWG